MFIVIIGSTTSQREFETMQEALDFADYIKEEFVTIWEGANCILISAANSEVYTTH